MKSIEMIGKTVEEAVKSALDSLKVTEDKVIIEVIEEESKGLFKFFKNKEAKIRVTVKKNPVDDAKNFLGDVLESMGILAEIEIKEEKNTLRINLVGPNMGVIIGHRGETLDALQYLVNLAVNKGNEGSHMRVIVDTEDYRAKREETLKLLANRLARKVKKTRRSVKLEPMNPYERRIIHYALQSDKTIVTFSEGEEPYRRVVIDLKKKA
ncbi:RNA-binding cell elongation regulator Jag/EloR [Clostridium grantii]|nr:RNA-binding cell elongation regulator Jag/EloR [Clostridium grantii]